MKYALLLLLALSGCTSSDDGATFLVVCTDKSGKEVYRETRSYVVLSAARPKKHMKGHVPNMPDMHQCVITGMDD